MVSPAIAAVDGWPFLVARGRRTGYRTLLAPAFLTAPDERQVLSESANGDGLRPGDVRRLELAPREADPMTLWFTVEPLSSAEHRDEHGRPLELLYGIVARGLVDGDADEDDIGNARSEALATFGRLIDGEEEFTVERSRPRRMRRAHVVQRPPAVEPPPRVARGPSRRQPVRVLPRLAVATLLIAAVSAWLARPSSAPEPGVSILAVDVTAGPAAARCTAGDRVDLHGTLELSKDADRSAIVEYRWLMGDATLGGGSVRLARGERRDVNHVATIGGTDADRVRFSLVIREPNRTRRAVALTPRCRQGL